MKHFVSFVILLLLLFLAATPVIASDSVTINEFSSSTSNDWVEVYNAGPGDVVLSDYKIRDSTETNSIDLDGVLPPGGYKVFDFGNKLNNAGDTIRLVAKNDTATELDAIAYGEGKVLIAPAGNQSGGRQPDGVGEWQILTESTKGSSNTSVVAFVAPTAAPTLSPTPKPQSPTNTPKAPTSTKVPTPTKTPTPTKVPTPSKTPTSKQGAKVVATSGKTSPTPTHGPVPSAVLGANTKKDDPKPSERISPTVLPVRTLGFSGINPALFFIAGGAVLLGGCGLVAYINVRRNTSQ